MAIRFSRSAARHGISRARAQYVVEACPCPLYPPPEADGLDQEVVVFLWPDAGGVPLEVVGLELADGDLLVIHAMKLRKAYFEDYARVLECLGQ